MFFLCEDNRHRRTYAQHVALAIGSRATMHGSVASSCGLRAKSRAKAKSTGTNTGKHVIGPKDTTPTNKHQAQAHQTNHTPKHTTSTPED